VSLHHQPILASGARSRPAASPGTAISEMPLAPGPPVRTATVSQSARRPEVMNAFSPSITHSAPSRRARQASRATSDPAPGSLIARAAIFLPARTSGTMRRCSASLPRAMTGGRPIECENRLASRPPLPARATSSVAIRRHGHRRRRAAEVLGVAEADQAGVGGLGVELARERAGFVPGVDVRRDLALDEAAHAGAERVARGELVGVDGAARAHARTSTSGWRTATWSPARTWSAAIVPACGARIWCSIFIASMTTSSAPARTLRPARTDLR
jgi:hypothetical protein